MYYGKLLPLACGKITARGWLKEQLERSKNGMGGNLYKLEPAMLYDPYVKKITKVKDWGCPSAWGAEISGNYWYGLICLAFTLPDKELQRVAGEWVNKVLAVQKEDGYLGTYTEQDDFREDYNAWGNYCGMRALTLYAEATGREDVFNAVYRGLLWFCHTDKWHYTDYYGHMILRLMYYYYRRTGDQDLLGFCRGYEEWLNDPEKDAFRNGINASSDDDLFYNQNHVGVIVNGPSRLAAGYLADGDPAKLFAAVHAIEKLHKKCLMVNGAVSGTGEWLSPRSATAESETCNATIISSTYAVLAAATGKAVYGDYIENVVYNVAQGARKKDEKAVTYFTAPNQLCATDHSCWGHDPHGMFAPAFRTSCCSVNSVVIMPEFVKNAVMTDNNEDLRFLSYCPVAVEHKNATVEVETLYPFREQLTLRIKTRDGKPADFSIYLRFPKWCEKMELGDDGEIILSADEDGFVKLSGPFADGKIIKIRLEMLAHVVEMDDTDGADKHPLSVVRGPLCFCLPVKETWIDKGNGYAYTKLPEGWSWYEVQKTCEGPKRRASFSLHDSHTWNFAATRESLEENLEVTEEVIGGYVWENPPVSISVNGWHAPYLYADYTPRTNEPYGKTVPVSFKKRVKLIPYGCTALRITCFPKADLSRFIGEEREISCERDK